MLKTRLVATIALGSGLALTPAPAYASGPDIFGRIFAVASATDSDGPLTDVVAIDVAGSGVLEQRESYVTAGLGDTGDSPQSPSIDAVRGRLFVPNNTSDDLSVFTIAADWTLTEVPGSPFPAGDAPTSTALHPNGKFLYVSQWREATIGVYEVAEDGGLSPIQTVQPGRITDLEVAPGGVFLYAADLSAGVRGFRISDAGALTEMAESPFVYPSGRTLDIEVSKDGRRVFTLDLDTGLVVFAAADTGELTLQEADGHVIIDGHPSHMLLAAADRYLYVCTKWPFTVQSFSVGAGAALEAVETKTLPGSGDWQYLLQPGGADRLYVIAQNQLIAIYDILEGGELSDREPTLSLLYPDSYGLAGAAFYRPPPLAVEIDFRPGAPTNVVRPGSRGVLAVAVLGGANLDAATVDAASLRLGPGGAQPQRGEKLRDVNLDGHPDLVVTFRTPETGIECGHESVELVGDMLTGPSFAGRDSIRTVGCPAR